MNFLGLDVYLMVRAVANLLTGLEWGGGKHQVIWAANCLYLDQSCHLPTENTSWSLQVASRRGQDESTGSQPILRLG